jgi:hypothetical protein
MRHRIPMQTRRDYKIIGPFTMSGLGMMGAAALLDVGWLLRAPWPIPLRIALGLIITASAAGAALLRWPATDGGDGLLTWVGRIFQYYLGSGAGPKRLWKMPPVHPTPPGRKESRQ